MLQSETQRISRKLLELADMAKLKEKTRARKKRRHERKLGRSEAMTKLSMVRLSF
jgi:hypothetical protein